VASSHARPNIVVLHCHDLGRFLGCYGHATVTSPNLDGLATSGIRLADAFGTAPQCSPARASLFTGRWPHANGVLGLTHANFGWDLHPGEQHLAGRLRAAGYQTVLEGTHHESRRLPDWQVAQRLGFDQVDSSGFAADVAQRALRDLDAAGDDARPFYLQVGFEEPHRLAGSRDAPGVTGFLGDHLEPDWTNGVWIPPYLHDSASAREEIAELQGAIRHMDEAAGTVLNGLRERGLEEETLVVFTTDHGLALPRAKCTLYEPGLQVAMLARYPARGWGGGRSIGDGMVSHLDLVPTVLELLELPQDPSLHGHSLVPMFDGLPYDRRRLVFGEMTHHDYYDPRRSVRTPRFKLIANFSSAPAFMDCSQSWSPRCNPVANPLDSHPPLELFDLADDPDELTNLADRPEYAATMAELAVALLDWMRTTGDPLLQGAVTPPLHRMTLEQLANAGSQA
jgi:N-sulfoglucosamine sulfohydrolase